MNLAQVGSLSDRCIILGFASIAIWFLTGGTGGDRSAHTERFGIVVGFWTPTFSPFNSP